MQAALIGFTLDRFGRDVVAFEHTRVTGQANTEEASFLHDVQNVSKRHGLKMSPQTKTDRPLDIPILRDSFAGPRSKCGKRGRNRNQKRTASWRETPGHPLFHASQSFIVAESISAAAL